MTQPQLLARTLLVCAAFALAACDSTPDPVDGGPASTGDTGPSVRPDADGGTSPRPDVPDTGPADADSGPRDADSGPGDADTGPRPPTCVDGAEGCACTTTATRAAVPFVQEDCEAGLLCVSWDLISGMQVGDELDAPVKSCVRPCQQDAECGVGRTCAAFGFGAETGAGRICVDALAGFDEICSGSRLTTERVVDPETENQADTIVACQPGLDCQIGTFGDFFNPDEAVCLGLCDTDADCTNPALPYCNPRFFASTSTTDPFLGVCSTARLPHGALCGSTGGQPFRISTACDTSEATCGTDPDACPICVAIPFDANSSLTPTGQGVCISRCTDAVPCAGDRTCVPEFFQDGAGACSDQCSPSPDLCGGAGSVGHGQDCLPLGDAAFCTDRQAGPLAPSTWSADGQLLTNGGDCTGDLESASFFRCPEGAFCAPTQQGGLCVFGCTPGDAVDGAALCRTLLNTQTATCAEPQAGVGVCGS